MNKKKKNISLFVGENKQSLREKGRNLSQKFAKIKSGIDNQKSMIIKNLDRSINMAKTYKFQNKSFDISLKQKPLDVSDKKLETNAFTKYIRKSSNQDNNESEQMTPMFSKITNIKGSKFTDVSKSSSFKMSKTVNEKKIRDKVLYDSKSSFSRNNNKSKSFDLDQNTSLINNSLNKSNHSFAFNSRLINHLNNSLVIDKTRKDSQDDLIKSLDEKLNVLDQKVNKDSINYFSHMYNIYKGLFDEVLKSFPKLKEFRALLKVIEGYNHVTINLVEKCKKFQDKSEDLEESDILFYLDFNKLNDEITSLKKLLIFREEELEKLKIRLSSEKLSLNLIHSVKEKSCRIFDHQSNFILTNDDSNPHINDDNILQNLDNMESRIKNDLDAIYFPDKVKMRSKSACENKVPKLDFNAVKLLYSKYNNNSTCNNNISIDKQVDQKNVEMDAIKTRIVKNCNTPILSHSKGKNYIISNSNKKVVINIENNQDKNNNRFINK